MNSTRRLALSVVALLAVVLAGCRAGQARRPAEHGQIVLRGEELTTSGVLLEALGHRVPTMYVSRPAEGCPLVNLRGRRGGGAADNAALYIDGTRMRDTCMLLYLHIADIDRVELYPVAAGAPHGTRAGPGGLILVYRRR